MAAALGVASGVVGLGAYVVWRLQPPRGTLRSMPGPVRPTDGPARPHTHTAPSAWPSQVHGPVTAPQRVPSRLRRLRRLGCRGGRRLTAPAAPAAPPCLVPNGGPMAHGRAHGCAKNVRPSLKIARKSRKTPNICKLRSKQRWDVGTCLKETAYCVGSRRSAYWVAGWGSVLSRMQPSRRNVAGGTPGAPPAPDAPSAPNGGRRRLRCRGARCRMVPCPAFGRVPDMV